MTYQSWIELWCLDLSIFNCGVYPLILIKEGPLCGQSSFTYQSNKLWRIPSLSYFEFFFIYFIEEIQSQKISSFFRLGSYQIRIATKFETNKLLQARFVKEARYTWLANVVLVKKASET